MLPRVLGRVALHWGNDGHITTGYNSAKYPACLVRSTASILFDKIRGVEVRFAQSARKHRIGKAHAMVAITDAGEPLVAPERDGQTDDRLVFVGKDDRGVELEVIAVQLPNYLYVIHVVPYRYWRRG